MLPRVAYLALGSNLGDRAANIAEALRRLAGSGVVDVTATASLLETAPMYVTQQPTFLNTCIEVRTRLEPHDLLDLCLDIELAMGRVRDLENGPRIIDLDIILFGDLIVDDGRLRIPHPAMLERDFVLVPLAEIAADVVHPLRGLRIAELGLQQRDRRNDRSPEESVD